MLEQSKGTELIFFDPDNGLEVNSRPWGNRPSPKHLYWREVQKVFQRGQSILVYQHFPRVNREPYIQQRKAELKEHLGAPQVIAFQTSFAVFFLMFQFRHRRLLGELKARVKSNWREQFDVR